jgi:hypothetical protein
VPGDAADPRGYFLNCRHQLISEKHGPADPETKLGTGLTIGTNAGRVVVGCASDQPRAKPRRKPSALSFLVLFFFVTTTSNDYPGSWFFKIEAGLG